MKKFIGISLGLLTLLPFIAVSFLIYVNFPTTPALIVTLIILMAGVLLAYFVYTTKTNVQNDAEITVKTEHFPAVESGMIYVTPSDFVSKLDKIQGNLYLIGLEGAVKSITITDGKYNQLTDELILKYTNGLQTTIQGINKVAVGNQQFALYNFDKLTLIRNKEKTFFSLQRNKLIQQSGKNTTEIKIKSNTPTYIFSWDTESE